MQPQTIQQQTKKIIHHTYTVFWRRQLNVTGTLKLVLWCNIFRLLKETCKWHTFCAKNTGSKMIFLHLTQRLYEQSQEAGLFQPERWILTESRLLRDCGFPRGKLLFRIPSRAVTVSTEKSKESCMIDDAQRQIVHFPLSYKRAHKKRFLGISDSLSKTRERQTAHTHSSACRCLPLTKKPFQPLLVFTPPYFYTVHALPYLITFWLHPFGAWPTIRQRRFSERSLQALQGAPRMIRCAWIP